MRILLMLLGHPEDHRLRRADQNDITWFERHIPADASVKLADREDHDVLTPNRKPSAVLNVSKYMELSRVI